MDAVRPWRGRGGARDGQTSQTPAVLAPVLHPDVPPPLLQLFGFLLELLNLLGPHTSDLAFVPRSSRCVLRGRGGRTLPGSVAGLVPARRLVACG